MVNIGNDWDTILKEEFSSANYQNLRKVLAQEYKTKTVYPDMYDIFNAFKLTAYADVKVVLLGQDPYHGVNQAHGLAFSVKSGQPQPPSLVNIVKNLNIDLGIPITQKGCLECWARQGVLLLNTVLTVRAGEANSHKNLGWTSFTDEVIRLLDKNPNPIVFMLWGGNAKSKKPLLTNKNHLVLESVHPSPLSCYNGFFENHHFSKANAFLQAHGVAPVNWEIT